MSDHYGQFDRSSQGPSDLERALHYLQEQAEPGFGWAHEIVTELARLRRIELAGIRYFRRFDHLIGENYPQERYAFREALNARRSNA